MAKQKKQIHAGVWTVLLLSTAPLAIFADSTWVGGTSDDLNTASNWAPSGVPGSTDTAIFDSLTATSLAPNATTDFSIGTLNFPNSASAFAFTIDNCKLALEDITGAHTNTTITVSNIDNSTDITGNLVSFSGSTPSLGSATFHVTNSGTSSGSISGVTQSKVSHYQVGVSSFGIPLTIGTGGAFTVTNIGVDSTVGTGGNQIGYLANSQMQIDGIFTAVDSAVFTFSNTGTYTGQNDTNGNVVGYVGNPQLTFSNSFTAGEDLTITVTNVGTDSSDGIGGNLVGYIGDPQLEFSDPYISLNNTTISISNRGTDSGIKANGDLTAVVTDSQLTVDDTFSVGDHFSITATNEGTHSSTGSGGAETGYISSRQLSFGGAFSSGDNATFTVSNTGTSSGDTTSGNSVGFISNAQIAFDDIFQTGDFCSITVTNSGTDSSSGVGNNNVGHVASYQLAFNSSFLSGDNTTITASNSGIGSSVGVFNQAAFIGTSQVIVSDAFQTGNSLTINISNSGSDTGTNSGSSNNFGVMDDAQLHFASTCTILDDATITLSNVGTNTSSTADVVGVVFGEQIVVAGAFSAGKNLHITATNESTTSVVNTNVGVVYAQMKFQSGFTAGDGLVLIAENNGSNAHVNGSQIVFQNGFEFTGTARLTAINEGSVNGNGISMSGTCPGGDLYITLQNSSLLVNSTPTFEISSLTGDANSLAKVDGPFTINTPSTVNAVFAGSIQDATIFIQSSLIKTGAGSQTLSGANAYSGGTTVEEGTLIANGSFTSDIEVDLNGILKGNGSIAADVTVVGTIAPGESIGTLTMGSYTNNGGTYEAELNNLGESDLINVTGLATINGGTVLVSSAGGGYVYQTPYTIVTSAGRTGTYTQALSAGSFITPTLTYDLDNVYLTIQADTAAAAKTFNERAVAGQLDAIIAPNETQTRLLNEIVTLSASEAASALDSVSGWQYTNTFFVAETVNEEFIRRLYDPIRSLVTSDQACGCACSPCVEQKCCDDYSTWLEAGGTHSQLSGNSNAHSITLNGWEITGGIQKTFHCNWTLGVAGSYEHDHIKYSHSGGSSGSDTWLVGLYGLYRPTYFYTLVDFAYGQSLNDMKRSINVGSDHFTGHGTSHVSQFTFYGETGVDWNLSPLLLQPFFGLETGSYWQRSVREHYSGGWGLHIEGKDRNLLSSRLGVHLTSNKIPHQISISLDMAWDKRYFSNHNTQQENFYQFGDTIQIKGVNLGSNSFDYALTFTKCINEHYKVYLRGSGEIWNQAYECNALAGFEFSW